MPTHIATSNGDGRLTIPAELRRALDLNDGDQVTITQHGEHLLLRHAPTVTERTIGILYCG